MNMRSEWSPTGVNSRHPMLPPLHGRTNNYFSRLLLLVCILLNGPSALAVMRGEAFFGVPYGVGFVTVSKDRGSAGSPSNDERFTVTGDEGRVLFPVLKEAAPARRLLRRFLEIDNPTSFTAYFLFEGEQPIELKVHTPTTQAITITPTRNERAHRRHLDRWWSEYSGRWDRLQGESEYPMVVENYLTTLLALQLGKTLPENPRRWLPWRKKKSESVWDELFATERYRLRIDRELLQGVGIARRESDPIDLENRKGPSNSSPSASSFRTESTSPLPNPIAWSPPTYPALGPPGTPQAEIPLDEIPVEPIASYVPEECFYLRFGTFTNYLWFRDLSKKWQGNLQNMILRRGIQQAASQRTQQQLALRETVLAKILGPQVIGDVALIGLDPYLAQGAAIGILFQAKDNALLAQDLMGKRREALQTFPNATEANLTIAEHEISLIETPDGKVRSYYAQDGDFHLVTTSRALVERFYQSARKERSLAISDGFRHIRRKFPLDRKDSVFAYVSSAFLQQLCSPTVRIHNLRRMQQERSETLFQLARLTATAQGISGNDEAELIQAGLLPSGFHRPHQAHPQPSGLLDSNKPALDGSKDSAREPATYLPGFELPIADRPAIQDVTREELVSIRKFSARLRESVGQLPPIAVGIQRKTGEEEETITAQLLIPYTTGFKLDSWADNLGEPNDQQLAPVPGDVGSLEVVLDIPVPLIGGEKQPHHLFGGLRDFQSPLALQGGKLVPGGTMPEFVRGYLGAWPRPGVLELLGARPAVAGTDLQQVNDQLWQAQRDPFLLLSFKPDVIEEVLPHLALQDASRSAQIRLRVDTLADKQLASTINSLGYMRTREASLSACRFMNTLANQLHVPAKDCRTVGESLIDGEFLCPLGGKYQLVESPGVLPAWTSSALSEGNRFLLTAIPDDFQLPLLEWFRGLHGDVRMLDQEISAHLEIKLSRAAVP